MKSTLTRIQKHSWVWCIPGLLSPLEPIMMLFMTTVGRCFLLTSVVPSAYLRTAIAGRQRCAELAASREDLALVVKFQ